MKKISISALLLTTLFLGGCLKDTPNNDFSTVGTIVEIPYSGLENFNASALNLPADPTTLTFVVNIASPYPLSTATDVTIGVDDTKRTAYNATGGTQYEAMPANAYELTQTKATIAAGTRQATFSITFHNTNIDPAKNLMLPISITDASGKTISGNFGTIYYHAIGNALAGTYDDVGTRTGYVGAASGGVIAYIVPVPSPKVLGPVSPTEVVADYADLGTSGWQYVIDYDGTTLTVSDNATMDAGIAPSSFVVDPPLGAGTTHYDAGTKTLYLYTGYTNTSGNDRIIAEVLTHQ